MADHNEQNRITVDLQLLQSSEMKLLTEFGEKFSAAVDTLNNALRDYGGQIGMHAERAVRQGVARPGDNPHHAGETIPGLGRSATPVRPYHEVLDGRRDREDGLSRFGKKIPGAGRLGQYSFADSNLNAYERGNISFGSIGEPSVRDTFRYLSALSGRAGYRDTAEVYDVHSRKNHMVNVDPYVHNRAAAGFSDVTGAIARGANYAGSVRASLGGIGRVLAGGSHTQVAPYAQLGYETGNGMFGGSGMFSDATDARFTGWFKSHWNALRNANWGKQQEDQLRSSFMSIGVDPNHHENGKMLEDVRNAVKTTGLDSGTLSSLMKRSVRYGSKNDLRDLGEQIQQLSQHAREAKMNVQEFTQGVMQLADAMTSRTGVGQRSAMSSATQFTASTGLSGEVGSNMMNNDIYMYGAMAAGGRGTSPRDVSPTDATMQMMTMLPGFLGASNLDDLSKKWRSGETDADGYTMQDRFSFLLQSPTGRQLFAGMDENQLGHLIGADGRAGIKDRIHSSQRMSDVASGKSNMGGKEMLKVEKMLLGDKGFKDFRKDHKGEHVVDQMKALQNKFQTDPNKMTLDLTGPAKKLVKQLDKDEPTSRNRRNNSSSMGG